MPVIPRNLAFEKALALLAHPASLFALGVLLLNDHLLRRLWPAWWTGKLGDVAWLFFAPFALAALLAWVLPLREPQRERWSFGLSFALVGLVFTLVKVAPSINILATRKAADFLAAPLRFAQDPTDLLTLPVLCLSILFWSKTPLPARFSLRGWIALPIAALLTLANSGVPDPGIRCFAQDDRKITAGTGYTTFISGDGGLTWQTGLVGSGFSCEQKFFPEGEDWMKAQAPQPDTVYRFRPGSPIEVSNTANEDWQVVYTPNSITEPRELYYIKSRQGYAVYEPGPLDAIADPATGNMLFAMGHQGVLVHTAAGEWQWSQVANYRPLDPFPTADAFGLLLGGMLYLAASLFFLVYSALAIRWAGGILRIIILCLAWAAWLLVDLFFPPAQSTGYGMIISSMGVLGIFILSLPLAIEQTFRLARRQPDQILRGAGFGFLAGLVYFLPYILWLYSTLPTLMWATIFGLICTAAALIAGAAATRRALAHTQP